MVQKFKNQNISYKAFTLIEMVIVLVIIWIMLMATVFLSWEQIQKVKNKTVKESILAEMQSRYSRNLWSSSFAWKIYDTMDVTFSWWSNEIKFEYNWKWDESGKENTFTDRFEIRYIFRDYDYNDNTHPVKIDNIKLEYRPYKISCKIWGDEENEGYTNVVFVTRVNDIKDYCFKIDQKNCRLMEMTEANCGNLWNKAQIDIN
jgi:prepilin-type N-terminal cleavage/methylation domain-containing protein